MYMPRRSSHGTVLAQQFFTGLTRAYDTPVCYALYSHWQTQSSACSKKPKACIDTHSWHRGTPCRPGGRRWVHHLVWRRADAPWIQFHHEGFARAYSARPIHEPTTDLSTTNRTLSNGAPLLLLLGVIIGTCASRPWLIPSLSPYQRTLLGFPAVDSPYWTEYTLNAVAERYGSALDMAPYQETFAARSDTITDAIDQQPLQTLVFRLTDKEGYDPASGRTSWHYEKAVRWTLPEPTLHSNLNRNISEQGQCDSWGRPKADWLTPIQVQQWREEGFLLVDGLIPPVRSQIPSVGSVPLSPPIICLRRRFTLRLLLVVAESARRRRSTGGRGLPALVYKRGSTCWGWWSKESLVVPIRWQPDDGF